MRREAQQAEPFEGDEIDVAAELAALVARGLAELAVEPGACYAMARADDPGAADGVSRVPANDGVGGQGIDES